MNSNVLKILNQLGYFVENSEEGIMICDCNHHPFPKINVTQDKHDGVKFLCDYGQEIYIDSEGFIEIKVNDHLLISAHNLYNEDYKDLIRMFFFKKSPLYDYVMDIEIIRSSKEDVNGCIFTSIAESPLFFDEDNYLFKELMIEDLKCGANIKLAGKYMKTYNCTTKNYFDLIERFIKEIEEQYELPEKDIQEGFDIITPSVIGLIDNLVKRRDKNLNGDFSTLKKRY